jgi:ABC-type lipoprotein release transport system permease subunit
MAAATMLLVGASIGAAMVPAHRAAVVNPTDALRCE